MRANESNLWLDRLPTLAQFTATAANLIFLVYLVIYANANRSATLWTAVTIDITIFIVVVAFRAWRNKAPENIEGKRALAAIETHSRLFYWIRRTSALVMTLCAVFAFSYMSVDLTALLLALNGQSELSNKLYERLAPPATPELHPALSLELLAGAYIDAHRYEEAEPLELSVLKIRRDLVGDHHELIASIKGNLGDLYHRWGREQIAESYYLQALTLAKEVNLKQGYGSPLLKLGTLYREQKRFDEATTALDGALAIRIKKFGPENAKVAEVWQQQSLLLANQGRTTEAASLTTKADAIFLHEQKQEAALGFLPILIPLCAFLFFTQRNRLITKIAGLIQKRSKVLSAPAIQGNSNKPPQATSFAKTPLD